MVILQNQNITQVAISFFIVEGHVALVPPDVDGDYKVCPLTLLLCRHLKILFVLRGQEKR